MKGTIVSCMEELVKQKHGAEKWKDCLRNGGQSETKMYTSSADVPDAEVTALMGGIAKTLNIGMPQLMDAFGEHWSAVYAPRVYAAYFKQAKSARELLLNLDQIHTAMTKSISGARPPHFKYEWQGDKHLVMHYSSGRNMVAFMPGLVKGLAKHFNERLSVSVTGNAVHVNFP